MMDYWKCDVCHDERPDEFIAVLSRPIPHGSYNVKYCADRPACRKGAEEKTFGE